MKLTNALAALCILGALVIVGLHYLLHFKQGTPPALSGTEAWLSGGLVAAALLFAGNDRAEALLGKVIDHLPSFGRKDGGV